MERLFQRLSLSLNANNRIAWGRGYAAFSESNVQPRWGAYVDGQEEHHRVRTFADELGEFIERHGLRWQGDKDH